MTVWVPQHWQRDSSRVGSSEASRIDSGVIVTGHPPEIAAFQPVAVAFQVDDLGVMDEAVDHGGGNGVVAEDLTPSTWKWHRFVELKVSCWQGLRALADGPRFSRQN